MKKKTGLSDKQFLSDLKAAKNGAIFLAWFLSRKPSTLMQTLILIIIMLLVEKSIKTTIIIIQNKFGTHLAQFRYKLHSLSQN